MFALRDALIKQRIPDIEFPPLTVVIWINQDILKPA
jgi:hypothetical protein